MGDRVSSKNPRLELLRQEVVDKVLKPFQRQGWTAEIAREVDQHDCIEVVASRKAVVRRIAVLYSSGISNADYKELAGRVDRIFFRGQPYKLESFVSGVGVPVEPLDGFFAFLIEVSKEVEPDRSPTTVPRGPGKIRRLTAENPLDAVIARLQQFTSETLARKLVERRAETEGPTLAVNVVGTKATGVAYSMRSALDYIVATPRDPLNRRVVALYYGTMALAQCEMLASPSGPVGLDKLEAMTRNGHGLYTVPDSDGGIADLHVGVLARGFFPQWMEFLGHDTSDYPKRRPESPADVAKVSSGMACLLPELFASVPEIDDLFADVVGGPPAWIFVAYDQEANAQRWASGRPGQAVGSTYGLFIDPSGRVPLERLKCAGWPLAEIRQSDDEGRRRRYRARVDHAGHDSMWTVLPAHSSPFLNGSVLLFPTMGGLRQYRTIAAVTLYALSIMTRYMPRAWRSIEGGDQDHYLALVQASLAAWERILPEHFLESITGETVHTAQPGSLLA